MLTQADPQDKISAAQESYHKNGFYLSEPIIPESLVQRARGGVDAILRGEYQHGMIPQVFDNGTDPNRLRKIDQVHTCNDVLREVATHPAIGRLAAELSGRPWIQLWAVQMLYKPPGGAVVGNVGWHQDSQYWKYWEDDSELFTAWVALSDVTVEAGAMKFAVGSNHWGLLDAGDFFTPTQGAPVAAIPKGETWTEVPGVLRPGGVSFHHRYTYHGSGPNVSDSPRISLALHLRTDRSKVKADATDYYVSHIDDPIICPVIYDETR